MAVDALTQRAAAAQALGRALEPVAALCLELGFTSAELENLVRSVFVHQAIAMLARTARRRQARRAVSDVRVGLATGLHRNEIRKIRVAKPRVEPRKIGKRHRPLRILRGWSEDWRFLSESGEPLELPLHAESDEPSFEELIRKYVPGTSISSALSELRRSRAVQLLPEETVRMLSRAPRPIGMSAARLAEAADTVAVLTETVLHNLTDAESRRICQGSDPVPIAPARMPMIRKLLERRVRTFVESMEREFGAEATSSADAVNLRFVVVIPES